MFQTLTRLLGCTFLLPALRDRAGRWARASSGTRPSRKAPLCLEQLEDRVTPSLSAVGNATLFPSRAVVELQTYWQNGATSVGTGVMIDSFHVLTAGHNIYSYAEGGSPQNPNGGFAKTITVTPALRGNSAPFGTASMDWEYVTGTFMTWSANNPGKTGPGSQDIGLVTLNKAIGNSTGWLGMWYFGNDPSQLQKTFNGFSVSTAGYPGSNLHPTLLQDGQTAVGDTMYQESGTTSGVSSDGSEIEWSLNSIETHPGQSGSPVAIRDPKGTISVVGILVGSDPTANYGVATRISQSCFDWLTSCMQYDAAHRPPQPAPAPSTASISSTSTTNDVGLVSTSDGTTSSNPYSGTGGQPSLVVTPPGFSYDPTTQVLTITASAATNSYTFSQTTAQDQSGLHTTSTFVLNGTSFSLSDALLSQVIVNATTGVSSAVLVANDTYTGSDGQVHETGERMWMRPGGGVLSRIDAGGNAINFLQLSGFATSYAYLSRADSAKFTGVNGSGIENVLVTAGTYSYIFGGGEFHMVSGAPNVYGYAVNSIAPTSPTTAIRITTFLPVSSC